MVDSEFLNYELVCATTRSEFVNRVNTKIQEGFKPLGSHTISEWSKNEHDTTKLMCISMIKNN